MCLISDLDWNGLETMGFRGGDFIVMFQLWIPAGNLWRDC